MGTNNRQINESIACLQTCLPIFLSINCVKKDLVEIESQIETKVSFCSQRGKSNDWWLKMFTTLLFNTFIHLIKKIHWAFAVVLLNKTANWFDFLLNTLSKKFYCIVIATNIDSKWLIYIKQNSYCYYNV